MLLELSALPQIPGADSVVEPSGPQFGPVVGDVDAAGSVRVALELPGTAEHRVRNRGRSLPSYELSQFKLSVGVSNKPM